MPWRSALRLRPCAGRSARRPMRARRRRAASVSRRVTSRTDTRHWRVPVLAAFSRVPPPDRRECRRAVFRQRIGPAETVPARGALLVVGELRHDVVVPQQHAVERPGGGDELGAILGEDDPLDQRIDRRILDADVVARARRVGGRRTPEVALLVAGRQRLRPGRDDHVEIPAAQPVLVLRIIDGADGDGDAEALERGLVEQDEALGIRILGQDLDAQALRRSWH